MADKQQVLKHWYALLKPGGRVGFHAWPEASYVFGYVARQALKAHGVEYLAHSPYGFSGGYPIKVPCAQENLTEAVDDIIAAFAEPEGYIRLIVTRGAGPLGLNPEPCLP